MCSDVPNVVSVCILGTTCLSTAAGLYTDAFTCRYLCNTVGTSPQRIVLVPASTQAQAQPDAIAAARGHTGPIVQIAAASAEQAGSKGVTELGSCAQ